MIEQKKKLRLDELQVDSFITSINQGQQTVAIIGAFYVSGVALPDCAESGASGGIVTVVPCPLPQTQDPAVCPRVIPTEAQTPIPCTQ